METISFSPTQSSTMHFPWPQWRSQLIGRTDELATINRLLVDEHAWLVTLVGPGGVGKSRLAHASGERLATEWNGKVAWISFANVDEPEQFVDTIALAMGIYLHRDCGVQELSGALADTRTLLVLDNLEHIVDIGSQLAELSDAAPNLSFLATSRQPLHLRGEQHVVVSPFSVPDSESGASGEFAIPNDAVQLFVQRASEVDQNFTLTESSRQAVEEICAVLDGLPLAIELAAARTRLLSPEAMVPRLAGSLELLSGGPRNAPARQQTIRHTIRWSYELLSPEEQDAFRRLAVFAGGFEIDAAAAVLDDNERALDLVAALMDHSLLYRREESEPPRYSMLNTVKSFALELLEESGDLTETRDRHAAWYVRAYQREGVERRLNRTWLTRVEHDYRDLRAALTWMTSKNDIVPMLSLLVKLTPWWESRGSHHEGKDWLTEGLALSGDLPVDLEVEVTHTAAWLASETGDFDETNLLLERSRRLLSQIADPRILVRAENAAGAIAFNQGDYDLAEEHMQRALEMAIDADILEDVQHLHANLGIIATKQGDVERARKYCLDGLARSTDTRMQALHHLALTDLDIRGGDLESANHRLQITWNTLFEPRDYLFMLWAIFAKAEIDARIGRLDESAILMGVIEQLIQGSSRTEHYQRKEEHTALASRLRDEMEPGILEQQLATGRAMSLDDLSPYILSSVSTDSDPRAPAPGNAADRNYGITNRERDVLTLLVAGKSNPEIAGELFISERTVQSHVSHILRKLGVPSRSAAAAAAIRLNLT